MIFIICFNYCLSFIYYLFVSNLIIVNFNFKIRVIIVIIFNHILFLFKKVN